MSADVIDTNVVEIQFDNTQFINNVSQTIDTVDKLKESLTFDSHSFDSLSKATNNIDLSNISSNLESLSNRFSTLGIVGMTAIQRITNEAMTLAGKLGKLVAKPWQQIITGGTNRAQNIAQAQFQLQGIYGKDELGLGKLKMTMSGTSEEILRLTQRTEDEIVAMNAADYAVADTAYGLDSAAKAASVLATSGVDVVNFYDDLADSSGKARTEMQVALRAISGTAAMANSDYDSIAQIFEKVSGNGKIMTMELRQLSSHGLNAAATLRDYLNEVDTSVTRTENDIYEMVRKGEIDFMTFAKAMDSAYGDHAKDANNTFTGAFSNMKFALSKIGADFIGPLREKMIPVLNDVRLSIKQVQKALNFKMKFPGIEDEVSIVDMFVRAIHNLTSAAHDFFTLWMGGQNTLEQAMSSFANVTNTPFAKVKSIFDDVANGAMNSVQAISLLTRTASTHGYDISDVYKKLGETMDKTEVEIREMCENGEISFEEFANAISATFGNTVWDNGVSKIAQLFQNVLLSAKNLADALGSYIGPVIKAFFNVFTLGGVDGIVGAAKAVADFTDRLRLSVQTQKLIYIVAHRVFEIIKNIVRIGLRLASSIFKILEALAPLINFVLMFATVLANIVNYIIDIIVNSKLLNSVIVIVTKALQAGAAIILSILKVIMAIAVPLVNTLGEVFASLARGITSIDLSFIDKIIQAFVRLVSTLMNGSIMTGLTNAFGAILLAIRNFFVNLHISFESFNETIDSIAARFQYLVERIVGILTSLGSAIKKLFTNIWNFLTTFKPEQWIAIVEQVVAFGILAGLLRVATVVNSIGTAVRKYFNADTIESIANGIKSIARAFLELSIAAVILSSIPRSELGKTSALIWQITGLLIALTAAFAAATIVIHKMTKTADTTGKFLSLMGGVLKNFFRRIGKAATMVGFGVLALSIAGSLVLLFKAVKQFNDLDVEEFQNGIYRVFLALSVLSLGVVAIAKYVKTLEGQKANLVSASILLISFVVVLKSMIDVIKQYSQLEFDNGWKEWAQTFIKMAGVLVIFTAAIGILGQMVKASGPSMMGASIALLGFLVVLKGMTEVIQEYANLSLGAAEWIQVILKMAAMMLIFAGAIALLSKAISGGGGTSLQASLKGGLKYENNTLRFMGVILTILALVVLLRSIIPVMAAVANSSLITYFGTLIMMCSILGMVALTMNQVKEIKNSKAIWALVGVIGTLGLLMGVMTLFNAPKMILAALSLSSIIAALSLAMKQVETMDETKVVKGVATMMVMLLMVSSAMVILSGIKSDSMLEIALSIGIILSALSLSMAALKNVQTFDPSVFTQMIALVAFAGIVVAILNQIKVVDPESLLTLTSCVSMLALVMGAVGRLTSGIQSTNADAILVTMIGIGIAISMIMATFAIAARIVAGHTEDLKSLAIGMLLLVPVIAAVSLISVLLSDTKNIMSGILAMGAILGLIAVFTALIAAIALIPSMDNAIKLLGTLGLALLALVPFIAVMSVLSIVFGAILMTGIGTAVLISGFMAIIAILGTIVLFTALMATIASLGDVDATISLVVSIGFAMMALIPFIAVMAVVCAALGVVGALVAPGMVGFAAMLVIISLFAGAMAVIASIGEVDDTIKLISSLGDAMMAFMPIIVLMGKVCLLLAAVLPVLLVGLVGLSAILLVVTTFVRSIVEIAGMEGIDKMPQAIESIMLGLQGLTVIFITMLSMVTSATAAAAASVPLYVAVMALYGLCSLVGMISGISVDVSTGMMSILTIITGLMTASVTVTQINYSALLTFVGFMTIFATSIDILALAKLLAVTSGLVAALTPLLVISSMSSGINNGLTTIKSVINQILDILTLSSILDPEKIEKLSKSISSMIKMMGELMVAAGKTMITGFAGIANIYISFINEVGRSIGINFSAGIVNGLLNAEGLTNVFNAALTVAKVMENTVRDALGIHSPSWLGELLGYFFDAGIASGVNSGALEVASSVLGVTDTMNEVGMAGGEVAGANTAASYIDSFLSTMNVSGLDDIIGSFNFGGGQKLTNGLTDSQIKALEQMKQGGMPQYQIEQRKQEWIKNNKAQGLGQEDLFGFNTDDFSHWTDGLFKDFNLDELTSSLEGATSGMDDFGNAIEDTGGKSKKTSKEFDELKKKVQQIMEKYEDLWDDAKDRASKDLFKGVEQQGDDFLDDIKDIMDKFHSIYKDAVDKTNGEDLFAEVKEDDESFAPQTLINNLQDQVNQINELNTIVSSLSGRVGNAGLIEAISNMTVDDLPQLRALYRMNDKDLGKYETLYAKKVEANQSKIQNELSGNLSRIMGKFTNVATFNADEAIANQVARNLQAQIDKLNEYNETVASLTSRIKDVDLREAIAHLGVESLPELRALNSKTADELDAYEQLYKTKMVGSVDSIKQELSTELSALLKEPLDIDEFYAAYKAGLTEFSDIDEADGASYGAGQKIGERTAAGASDTLKEEYSNEEAYEIGKSYTQKVAEGMQDQEAINTLEQTLDSVSSMIKDFFYDIGKADMFQSGVEMVKGFLDGIEQSKDEGFDEVIDGITQRILETFAECADDYQQGGRDVINEFCKGLQEVEATTYLELAVDEMINSILSSLEESYMEFNAAGISVMTSFVNGLKEQEGINDIEETVNDMVNIILATLSIENTYEDYYECGHTIIHEFCKGIEDGLDSGFDGTIISIINRIRDAINSQEAVIIKLGEFIDYGLAKGMRSSKALQVVEASAKSVANKAISAAKKMLDSHSPSKVFEEIGRFVDEGFAIGMRDYSGLAEDEASNMANGSISAVQEAINQLSGMLDGTIDVNPTITPTLDLSEVNAKSAALANMFNGRQVAVQAYADDRQAEMMTQLGDILAEQNSEPRSITFNQTNNSPKALSNAEIYRQTKNGFSRLVGAYT